MNTGLYKYEQVAARLRERIAAGAYANGRLPRDGQLAAEFNVSKVPVNRALNLLREEGLLERVKGHGTFVRDGSRPLTLLQQVGVMTPRHDHFYGPLHEAICSELLRKDCFALSVHNAGLTEDWAPPESTRRAIRRLLGAPIRGLIVNGLFYWRFRFLEEIERPTVIVHCFDADGPLPGPAVLTDLAGGIASGVEHLVDLGHRRIALMTVRLPAELESCSAEHYDRTPLGQISNGYRRAMEQHGMAAELRIVEKQRNIFSTPELRHTELVRLLTATPRPTAVICQSDTLAVQVGHVATELGLKLPDDLALVGLYNTPWSHEGPIPLTSIDCGLEELARLAVALLLAGDQEPRLQYVQPKLIIRKSSGEGPK